MITNAAQVIAKDAAKASILDSINYIAVYNASGEYFRKQPTAVDAVSTYKRKYTLYLTESEANTAITDYALISNGTSQMGTGSIIANQTLANVWDKTTGPQSGYF